VDEHRRYVRGLGAMHDERVHCPRASRFLLAVAGPPLGLRPQMPVPQRAGRDFNASLSIRWAREHPRLTACQSADELFHLSCGRDTQFL
jgi:hypothetical protein